MENLPPNEVLKNLKKKAENKNKWRKINHARYTIYVIIALCMLSFFVMWNQAVSLGQELVLYVILVYAGIFLGISFWLKYQPKTALIVAIAVFIFPFIIAGMEDPSTIFEGIWWKIIILGLFLRGLLSVKHISNKQVSDDLIDDFEL